MKKLLTLLLTMVAVFALVSCGGDDNEEEKRMTFEDYLAQNDAMTVEEFDEEFTPEEKVEIPADLPSNLSLYNTHIDIKQDNLDEESEDNSAYMYLWQNSKKLHIYGDAEGDIINYYLDLSEVEVMYDDAISSDEFKEASKYLDKKPSELANELLDLLEEEIGLVGVDLSLEKVFTTLDFKYEDFTEINSEKYQLNNSALYAKASSLTNGLIPVEQFEAMVTQSQITYNIYVLFDGYHVTGIELDLASPLMEIEGTVTLKVGFGYAEDKLNSLSIEANVPDVSNIICRISYSDETISVYAKTAVTYSYNDEKQTETQEITASYGKNNIKVITKQNDLELANIDLTIVDQRIDDTHLFTINGKLKGSNCSYAEDGSLQINSTMTITITSGNSVVIPAEIKALESQSINALASNDQVEPAPAQ